MNKVFKDLVKYLDLFPLALLDRCIIPNVSLLATEVTGLPLSLEENSADTNSIVTPIAICVALVVFLMLIGWMTTRHCRQRKRTKNKNYPKDVVLNLMNEQEEPHHPGTSFRRLDPHGRLSSSQTMKEYISYLVSADPEWDVPYQNIQFKGILGEGAFGQVVEAVASGLPGGEKPVQVAVKRLKGIMKDVYAHK